MMRSSIKNFNGDLDGAACVISHTDSASYF